MFVVSRRFLLPEYLPYAGIFHERGQPGLATHSSVNRVLAGKHTLTRFVFLRSKPVMNVDHEPSPQARRLETVSLQLPATSLTPPSACSGGTSPSLTFLRSVMVKLSCLLLFANSAQLKGGVALRHLGQFCSVSGSLVVSLGSCSASVNVLVPNCKIYNDASCDISADGQLLAVFIPSSQRGFPDEGILAIYSLAPHNLGEMLYTKRFGTVSCGRPASL